MTSKIIAIEDWVLPQGTAKAAKNRAEYLERLREADRQLKDPNEVLLTWGYHQYFHGELKKADLDAISTTRPILVWHRSGHEFFLNSVAERQYGVTKEWFDKQSDSAKKQSDFGNAHYGEQGAFAVMPLIASAIASPARVAVGARVRQELLPRQRRNAGQRTGWNSFEEDAGRTERAQNLSNFIFPRKSEVIL